jgi:hypothetical protein
LKKEVLESVEIITRWNAHYNAVTSLNLIENPPGILSSSKDKRVRVWDRSGIYWGSLRQSPGGSWNFPLDRTLQQQQEEKKVEEIFNLLKVTRPKQRKITFPERHGSAPNLIENKISLEQPLMDRYKVNRRWSATLKTKKFAPNTFFETTRARMRSGTPNLDKFAPSILLFIYYFYYYYFI